MDLSKVRSKVAWKRARCGIGRGCTQKGGRTKTSQSNQVLSWKSVVQRVVRTLKSLKGQLTSYTVATKGARSL